MNDAGQGCLGVIGLLFCMGILMSCFEACTGTGQYKKSGPFDGMTTEQANEKKLEMLLNNENW